MLIKAKIFDLLYKYRLAVGRIMAALLSDGDFYIHGADILPAPLDAEEEAELMQRLDGDSSLRQVLVERNLRLVVYIAKKFENTGTGIEDLISIGTIGLIKAANTYRPDKCIKFATYASRCAENEILMYLRKNQNSRGDISIDEPLNIDWDGNELLLSDILGTSEDAVWHDLECDEERRILHQAIRDLDERERVIIELRYGIGGAHEMTQKEVADLLGISQSYISRLEKKIISDMRETIGSKF